MRLVTLLAASATALLFTACASVHQIDAQVESAAPVATAQTQEQRALLAGAHYRFEQLPLQSAQPGAEHLQAMAQAALARAGLVRDDAAARVTVQVSAHISPQWTSPWYDPYWDDGWGFWPGRFYFGLGSGGFYGGAWMWDSSYRYYNSRVSLVMRDAQNGQVLYETRAQHEGARSHSDTVLQALFDAALQDFPHPPAGRRRVVIPLAEPKP
ncbi:MAG: DUF4136 domain-containing protein [Ottowia sp.]